MDEWDSRYVTGCCQVCDAGWCRWCHKSLLGKSLNGDKTLHKRCAKAKAARTRNMSKRARKQLW